MNRRSWLLAGGGAAALAAGVAGFRWQERKAAAPEAPSAAAGSAAAAAASANATSEAVAALWTSRFEQPDGRWLDMSTLRGRPLLLNFWGTWCPPCVKEMPELDRFARQFGPQGWQVVGLAVDNPKAVREFLARAPVSYTIVLAGFEGSELVRQLGNTQGGLPFTVALNRSGAISHQKAGATTLEELTGWAQVR